MLSVGKIIETEIARLNTKIIDNDAYVKHVVIESTGMRKFCFKISFKYIIYIKMYCIIIVLN